MKVTKRFSYNEIQGFTFGFHPFAKPTMLVNIYFIDGLLIDTGPSLMKHAVLKATKNLPLEQLIVTHHHEDHSGNISEILNQHNIPAFASQPCCELMKNPPKLSLVQKLTWGNRPPTNQLIPIESVIKTKNYTFQLIPIPGHASDLIALYEPERKWLFSADLYINSYIDYMLYNEDIALQIQSTKRILQLDFDTLLCSHRPKFGNGKEQLLKKLHFLESFVEQVSSLHAKGLSVSEILKALKLQENYLVRFLSGGKLSKANMVKSVIRNLEMKA